MRTIINQLNNYSITRSVIFILFGIIILLAPLTIRNLIFYLFSAYLTYFAILNFYSAYQNKQQAGGFLGIEFIIGGMLLLLAIINLTFIDAISRFIPIILGVLLIINALIKLSFTGSTKEVNPKYRMSMMAYSAVIIIAGLTLIFNPFGTDTTILRIFGSALIIIGAIDLTTPKYNIN